MHQQDGASLLTSASYSPRAANVLHIYALLVQQALYKVTLGFQHQWLKVILNKREAVNYRYNENELCDMVICVDRHCQIDIRLIPFTAVVLSKWGMKCNAD